MEGRQVGKELERTRYKKTPIAQLVLFYLTQQPSSGPGHPHSRGF